MVVQRRPKQLIISPTRSPVQQDEAAAEAGTAMDAAGDRRSLRRADTRQPIINRMMSDVQQQRLTSQTQSKPEQFKEQKKPLFQSPRPIPEAPSTSADSTAKMGSIHEGDWQEEAYQKIKSMKEMYFIELNEVYQKIVAKLHKHDSLSQEQKNIETIEKLRLFKGMFEKILKFLRLKKNEIQLAHREKIGSWEKHIVNFLSKRPKLSQQPHSQSPHEMLPHQNQMNDQILSANVQDSSNLNLDPAEGSKYVDGDLDEARAEAQVHVPDQGAEVPGAPRAAASDAGDWRSQLQAGDRQRIVEKLMEVLRKQLDRSDEKEVKKIAVRFEEKIYNIAASQRDYLRKISLKMLVMESKSQTTIRNKNPTNSVPRQVRSPRSVPSSSSEGTLSLPSPPQKKRSADDTQRLPFGARSPKRFLMAETFDVGKEVIKQSMSGYDPIFEDEAVGCHLPSTSLLENDKARLMEIVPSNGLCTNLLDHLTKGVEIASLLSERLAMMDEQKEQIKKLHQELDHYKDNYAKMIEAYDWIGDLVRAREEQIQVKDRLLAERDIKIAELEKKLQEATNGAKEVRTI